MHARARIHTYAYVGMLRARLLRSPYIMYRDDEGCAFYSAIRALSTLSLSVPDRSQSHVVQSHRSSLFPPALSLRLSSFILSFLGRGIAPLLQPLCLLFESANYRSRLTPPPPATNRGYLRSEIDRFELRICAGASHFHIQVRTSVSNRLVLPSASHVPKSLSS